MSRSRRIPHVSTPRPAGPLGFATPVPDPGREAKRPVRRKYVRECEACGDRRIVDHQRDALCRHCLACSRKAAAGKGNGISNPTRTCTDCGRVDQMRGYYSPAQLGKLARKCQSCVRRGQIVMARKDIDDVAVLRLVNGEPPRRTTIGERMTAASILRARGATTAGAAFRMGVSVRTAERYFAELAAA